MIYNVVFSFSSFYSDILKLVAHIRCIMFSFSNRIEMLSLWFFIIIIFTDASIRLFPSPYWNGMYPTRNMWKISFQISRISSEDQCTFGKGLRILARGWGSWFTPGVKNFDECLLSCSAILTLLPKLELQPFLESCRNFSHLTASEFTLL